MVPSPDRPRRVSQQSARIKALADKFEPPSSDDTSVLAAPVVPRPVPQSAKTRRDSLPAQPVASLARPSRASLAPAAKTPVRSGSVPAVSAVLSEIGASGIAGASKGSGLQPAGLAPQKGSITPTLRESLSTMDWAPREVTKRKASAEDQRSVGARPRYAKSAESLSKAAAAASSTSANADAVATPKPLARPKSMAFPTKTAAAAEMPFQLRAKAHAKPLVVQKHVVASSSNPALASAAASLPAATRRASDAQAPSPSPAQPQEAPVSPLNVRPDGSRIHLSPANAAAASIRAVTARATGVVRNLDLEVTLPKNTGNDPRPQYRHAHHKGHGVLPPGAPFDDAPGDPRPVYNHEHHKRRGVESGPAVEDPNDPRPSYHHVHHKDDAEPPSMPEDDASDPRPVFRHKPHDPKMPSVDPRPSYHHVHHEQPMKPIEDPKPSYHHVHHKEDARPPSLPEDDASDPRPVFRHRPHAPKTPSADPRPSYHHVHHDEGADPRPSYHHVHHEDQEQPFDDPQDPRPVFRHQPHAPKTPSGDPRPRHQHDHHQEGEAMPADDSRPSYSHVHHDAGRSPSAPSNGAGKDPRPSYKHSHHREIKPGNQAPGSAVPGPSKDAPSGGSTSPAPAPVPPRPVEGLPPSSNLPIRLPDEGPAPGQNQPTKNPFDDPEDGTEHLPLVGGGQSPSDESDSEISSPIARDVRGAEGTLVAASEIFKPNAAPLHLPALDAFMHDSVRFMRPTFSDPRAICGEEESDLFGYGSPFDMKSDVGRPAKCFEIAGGQCLAPRSAFRADKVGKRHDALAEESDEEGDGEDDKASADSDEKIGQQGSGDLDVPVLEKRPALNSLDSDVTVAMTASSGVPSQLSTATKPVTRVDMFPPLMLLKEQSLDELKSNRVGPRKPIGGILGKIPATSNILNTVIGAIIGAEGSSFAAGIIRLELFRDFAQIMAANLHFDSTTVPDMSPVRRVFVSTIPSILALDFVSVFGRALIFLCAWFVVVCIGLWRFYRMTSAYNPNRNVEGFGSQPWVFTSPAQGTRLINVITVFILTALYIPLSKLALDTIVWNSDLWVVPNPYITDQHPVAVPLGDPALYRDSLDFCWTTTMSKDQFNFAWLVVPLAAITILLYTLWFPFRMIQVIKAMLPHVSDFNELGQKRTKEEMNLEYQRLLNRDKSPLNFIYNDYTRRFGFYKPLYMLFFKLSNVMIITFFTRNNCVWRGFETKTMLVVQQISLICLMTTLLVIHIFLVPFVDAISNRSEMLSRIGYVCTALIGLLVSLNVSGSTVYNTTILYIVMGVTYLGNGYLSLAHTSFFAHWVKRMQRRIDFSIDIFSPALDLDRHIKRRIWEETLSTVLLCGPSYSMPVGQVVVFSASDVDRWPPYLLYFQGSAAERHIENIKILKEIGLSEYRANVEYARGHVAERLKKTLKIISKKYTGPDAFWRPIRPPYTNGVSSWFGKAFLVPFPPTLVIRYDQAGERTVQLTTLEEFEAFVLQNSSPAVTARRMVRHALRALDGQRIFAPYIDDHTTGKRVGPFSGRPSYSLAIPVTYTEGVLRVHRKEHFEWDGYNFSSGFRVTVVYSDGRREDPEGATRVRTPIEVHASNAFGLHDDFEMTPQLMRMLEDNEWLVRERVPVIETLMDNYRKDFHDEARRKACTMSYAFLTDIFDNSHLTRPELEATFARASCSTRLRQLPQRYPATITLLYERLAAVNRSRVHQWWWLFWDDLWRKNSGDYSQLRKHRRAFSPHFPGSIAYRPMPRGQLQAFLQIRGMWSNDGSNGCFNRGFLNRIYFYLDEIVFSQDVEGHDMRANAVALAIGRSPEDAQMHGYDTIENALRPGSRFTGGGTVEDDRSIIERRAYPWEQRLNGRPTMTRMDRWCNRILELLNIHPFRSVTDRSRLYLHLRHVDGQYEIPDHPASTWSRSNDTLPACSIQTPQRKRLNTIPERPNPFRPSPSPLGSLPSGHDPDITA